MTTASLYFAVLFVTCACVLAKWEWTAATAECPLWTHGARVTLIAAFITAAMLLRGEP